MKERRSSSTVADHRSTVERLLAFPKSGGSEPRRATTTEKVFTIISVFILIVFAAGLSWSIANAKTKSDAGDLSATSRPARTITASLTDESAPTAAYVTGAMLEALMPLAGESGKLKAAIGSPGTPILSDTLPAG